MPKLPGNTLTFFKQRSFSAFFVIIEAASLVFHGHGKEIRFAFEPLHRGHLVASRTESFERRQRLDVDFCTFLIWAGHEIHGEIDGVAFTHCVVWRVNWYKQVFVHVKNKKKSFSVFAPFGPFVHSKFVAELTVHGGGAEGLADWKGQIWNPRNGL